MFPGLSTDGLQTKHIKGDPTGVVLGRGTLDGRPVFVKLAERGSHDIQAMHREAEIHVNRRIANMIKEEKGSSTSNCFLAAECHERTYDTDYNNVESTVILIWLRRLIEANVGKYQNASWSRTWNVVFFVMRPFDDPRSLLKWWDEDVCKKKPNSNPNYLLALSQPGLSEGDKEKREKRDNDRASVFAQLVLALEMLAKHGITHNDLHWDNIFVETIADEGTGCDYRPVIYDWDRAVMDVDKLPPESPESERSAVSKLNERFNPSDSAHEDVWHVAEHHPYVDLLALYKSAVMTKTNPPWLERVCEILEELIFKKHPGLRTITPFFHITCLPRTTSSAAASTTKCRDFVRSPLVTETNYATCAYEWSKIVEVPSPEYLAHLYLELVEAALPSASSSSSSTTEEGEIKDGEEVASTATSRDSKDARLVVDIFASFYISSDIIVID